MVDCGPNHHEAPGKLKSPNYPNLYPGETECQWIISTTKGKIISVKFLDFDVSFMSYLSYNPEQNDLRQLSQMELI